MAVWRRQPVGSGSSATVSLATSLLSGELMAIKSDELSKSDLLQNEQTILSSLNCPQIISYLGFEITPLRYNLFVEYATGGSLSADCGRLDEATIRSHTHDILTGLTYLHSRSIVHCDIQPQNILLGSDECAKITNFGCARWMNQADCLGSYQVMSTPMFVAPEIAQGEELGVAADVWALGCTVLEMATGSPSRPESNLITTVQQIAFSPATPEIPSWISTEGKDFLRKCLARDSDQRWTADQLLKHPFFSLSSPKLTPKSSGSSPKSLYYQNILKKIRWMMTAGRRSESGTGAAMEVPIGLWDESWTTICSSNEGSSVISTADHHNNDEVRATPHSSVQ